MAMGTRRRRQRQERLWISRQDLAKGPGHPFYKRVNELLETEGFDEFAEKECARFYAENNGRPSLTPGIYFRLLLVGYFEGIDSERGIAWRAADSFGLRQFLGIAIDEDTPDHSTISRTRRLIDVETHRKVFFWVLEGLRDQGGVKGKTVGIDATTLEANAAMRSIVRRDNGESYEEFLKGLVKESGIATPTREDLARLDRKRKNKASNKDWMNPQDPDARITKMKDDRTHLAHKAEHAVDLKTGAVLAVTLQEADQGDTTTVQETLVQAGENVAELIRTEAPNQNPQVHLQGIQEVVTDKGYHSGAVLVAMKSTEVRTYIPEKKQKGQRHWQGKPEQRKAVYENRRRVNGAYGKSPAEEERRTDRAELRALLRDRWNEKDPSARARKHFEATVASRRCVQSEPDFPLSIGIWHPTGAVKSTVPAYFCAFFPIPFAFQHPRIAQTFLFRRHDSA